MVFCGVDIGTTNTKAVVLDSAGQVMDEVTLPAPACAGEGREVYWYEHFSRVLDFFAGRGRFQGEEIACSVTGQGGSFVLLDDQLEPMGDAHSWTSVADDEVVRDLVSTLGEAPYYRLTGWPPHGWLAACKLKQMAGRGRLPASARHVATVPDCVYAQLAGSLCTDITSAQIAGLADFQNTRWSRAILDWIGIDEALLPPITPKVTILAEQLRSEWGKVTMVTGSHDQYAAMQAAGLAKDKTVMLGTGTAWVINGRTSAPLFDERQFLIHPGRDLHSDCFGFIITLWRIGAGFDRLLERLGLTRESLAQIEREFVNGELPQGPVKVDVSSGAVQADGDGALSVRRYMEWAGSVVAHALDGCGLSGRLDRIVATGGAMSSRFWPQVVSDVCGLTVEAIEYPQFTAYGAALHATEAVTGRAGPRCFPGTATVRTCTPQETRQYQAWYRDCQKPMLEAQEDLRQ
jgi:gluconokinase